MSGLTIILIGLLGILLGWYFGRKRFKKDRNYTQSKAKRENKEKIIEFVRAEGRISNDDVERLTGVSDATATNYLNELEEEGKITQKGKTGRHVFYEFNG